MFLNKIIFDENLNYLSRAPREAFSLIYIDPPFNTGRRQARTQLRTVADRNGDRIGFQGKRYRTERLGTTGFDDQFDDYIGFLRERINAVLPSLTPNGSLFLHVDYREVHYCKVMLDGIFWPRIVHERNHLGLTTTVLEPNAAGRPNTTICFGT